MNTNRHMHVRTHARANACTCEFCVIHYSYHRHRRHQYCCIFNTSGNVTHMLGAHHCPAITVSMKFQLLVWWIVYDTDSIICNLFNFLNGSECQLARAWQLDLIFVESVQRQFCQCVFVLYLFVWVTFVYTYDIKCCDWGNFGHRVPLLERQCSQRTGQQS